MADKIDALVSEMDPVIKKHKPDEIILLTGFKIAEDRVDEACFINGNVDDLVQMFYGSMAHNPTLKKVIDIIILNARVTKNGPTTH